MGGAAEARLVDARKGTNQGGMYGQRASVGLGASSIGEPTLGLHVYDVSLSNTPDDDRMLSAANEPVRGEVTSNKTCCRWWNFFLKSCRM